ncbi:polysaccharide pyruvyl transferase family protein [Nodularia sp. NIES-3585]|uniref:polysaccharide pyruvyl transferase family protein n=1 Tax=Nodularia sp. NIES-3585 TaxID=1973477 RepID=UPI000B5C33AF|nr:polysaccharide pyruvyl transferase family protein [Nodularia sp. NIES-3585]GAX34438.1 succinoglycan biosynthesis ketolase [Nodularia sp. NIES-3585]
MKLYYFRFPNGISNFGDNLNPWIWDRLLPGMFDEDKKTTFVGIGSLLNEYIPKAQKTVVFGSGVGYGKGLPNIDQSWKIYCVRGKLSAKALGVSSELAVTDSAVLIRRLYQQASNKVNQFAYMPHIDHAIRGDSSWKLICEQAGIAYIDPRWPIEQVLSAMSQTEVLLAEAMHGAIIADALRVPWIPVLTSARMLPFKWQDWCSSIDIEYKPQYVMPDSKLYPPGPRMRSSWRYSINCVKQAPQRFFKAVWEGETKKMAMQLADIAKTSKPILSSESRIEQLTVELEERLEQFKQDVASGYFHHSD